VKILSLRSLNKKKKEEKKRKRKEKKKFMSPLGIEPGLFRLQV